MQNMFLSCSFKSIWMVCTTIPHFTFLPGLYTWYCNSPLHANIHLSTARCCNGAYIWKNLCDSMSQAWAWRKLLSLECKKALLWKDSCAKNKLICPIHFCFGFLIIPVMNVRPKNFLISSTIMGTQIRCKVYPVKRYCATIMAWLA